MNLCDASHKSVLKRHKGYNFFFKTPIACSIFFFTRLAEHLWGGKEPYPDPPPEGGRWQRVRSKEPAGQVKT